MKNKPAHILVVDDEPTIIILISSFLNMSNYVISSASDGLSALSIVQKNKPDIILMDIRMPGMDGFETCEKLKQDPKTAEIPVIFLSSLIETSDIVRAFKVGAVDYILKPIQPEEIVVRLNTHLKLHQQKEELQVLNEHLKDSQLQLSKFSSHLQNVREIERSALALEIHNKIAQFLIALKIDIGILRKKMNNLRESEVTKPINQTFENTIKLVDSTINTVREIIDGLRPEQIDIFGFIEAIKNSVNSFEEKTGIISKFTTNVTKLDIDNQKSLILFQILKEALQNVELHAKATELYVNLDLKNESLILKIIDNGIGFDIDGISEKQSYGLLGMKQKVNIFCGKISFQSEINKGTTITVIIKLND